MIQKYYQSSVISRYIKQLINSTPLPIYKLIQDNEDMDEGCLYQFRNKLLRCTESGKFTGIRGIESEYDYLFLSDNITVSDRQIYKVDAKTGQVKTADFTVTDEKIRFIPKSSSFKVVKTFNALNYTPGINQIYNISSNSYDPKTHKYLGEYLRWIKNLYGLNLMPLYNCFTNQSLDGYHIDCVNSNWTLVQGNSSFYKNYIVPIKFNTEYTIALQSDFPVTIMPIFKGVDVLKDSFGTYLHEHIKDSLHRYSNLDFHRPIKFSVNSYQYQGSDMKYTDAVLYENCLYMLIQVPMSISSSISVIEGDFTTNSTRLISDIFICEKGAASSSRLDEQLVSSLSLLSENTGEYVPFSDKLIQYLLFNTIDMRTHISENISRVEEKVGYSPEHLGSWDERFRFILYNAYMNEADKRNLSKTDILGYVDADVESAINRGYIKFGTV